MTPLNRALVLHFNNNNTYKYLMTSASLKLSCIFKEEVGNKFQTKHCIVFIVKVRWNKLFFSNICLGWIITNQLRTTGNNHLIERCKKITILYQEINTNFIRLNVKHAQVVDTMWSIDYTVLVYMKNVCMLTVMHLYFTLLPINFTIFL